MALSWGILLAAAFIELLIIGGLHYSTSRSKPPPPPDPAFTGAGTGGGARLQQAMPSPEPTRRDGESRPTLKTKSPKPGSPARIELAKIKRSVIGEAEPEDNSPVEVLRRERIVEIIQHALSTFKRSGQAEYQIPLGELIIQFEAELRQESDELRVYFIRQQRTKLNAIAKLFTDRAPIDPSNYEPKRRLIGSVGFPVYFEFHATLSDLHKFRDGNCLSFALFLASMLQQLNLTAAKDRPFALEAFRDHARMISFDSRGHKAYDLVYGADASPKVENPIYHPEVILVGMLQAFQARSPVTAAELLLWAPPESKEELGDAHDKLPTNQLIVVPTTGRTFFGPPAEALKGEEMFPELPTVLPSQSDKSVTESGSENVASEKRDFNKEAFLLLLTGQSWPTEDLRHPSPDLLRRLRHLRSNIDRPGELMASPMFFNLSEFQKMDFSDFAKRTGSVYSPGGDGVIVSGGVVRGDGATGDEEVVIDGGISIDNGGGATVSETPRELEDMGAKLRLAPLGFAGSAVLKYGDCRFTYNQKQVSICGGNRSRPVFVLSDPGWVSALRAQTPADLPSKIKLYLDQQWALYSTSPHYRRIVDFFEDPAEWFDANPDATELLADLDGLKSSISSTREILKFFVLDPVVMPNGAYLPTALIELHRAYARFLMSVAHEPLAYVLWIDQLSNNQKAQLRRLLLSHVLDSPVYQQFHQRAGDHTRTIDNGMGLLGLSLRDLLVVDDLWYRPLEPLLLPLLDKRVIGLRMSGLREGEQLIQVNFAANPQTQGSPGGVEHPIEAPQEPVSTAEVFLPTHWISPETFAIVVDSSSMELEQSFVKQAILARIYGPRLLAFMHEHGFLNFSLFSLAKNYVPDVEDILLNPFQSYFRNPFRVPLISISNERVTPEGLAAHWPAASLAVPSDADMTPKAHSRDPNLFATEVQVHTQNSRLADKDFDRDTMARLSPDEQRQVTYLRQGLHVGKHYVRYGSGADETWQLRYLSPCQGHAITVYGNSSKAVYNYKKTPFPVDLKACDNYMQ